MSKWHESYFKLISDLFMFDEEETPRSVGHLSQNNVKRVKYSFAEVVEFGMVEAAL